MSRLWPKSRESSTRERRRDNAINYPLKNEKNNSMKKLTCRELGGACDVEITGNSFVELGKKCREHVMEQIRNGDTAHGAAATKMQNASPEEQRSMMAEFEKRYNAAPSI
jgi:predicted small metal-binding protein